MPSATILIPTHDHGRLLTRSVRSALEQTVADIEVVIVGDGISEEGRDAAREMMRLDGRVRFLDAPKGKRHGEPTRHAILAEVETDFVCYLSDDDLLLPDHVAQIRHLLGSADFAHSLPCYVQVDGEIGVWNVDLNLDVYRDLLLFGHNRIPLSAAAHTCEAYRRLPHGWRTTPPGVPTDLFMWQQFLDVPGMRFASGTHPTVLHFPSPERRSWTVEARLDELDRWSRRAAESRPIAGLISVAERAAALAEDRHIVDGLTRSKRFPMGGANRLPFARSIGKKVVLGLYEPATGLVEFLEPSSHKFQFGPPGAGWLPVCGDWDGDGNATIGLYDQDAGVFFLHNSMSGGDADVTISFGPQGRRTIPLAGDWFATGKDSVGLYDPHHGMFFLRESLAASSPALALEFGGEGRGFVPVAGDWTGTGSSRIGLYDPASGYFMLRHALQSGVADEFFGFGPIERGWEPFACRWSDTSKDDVGLYAAASGAFYLRSGSL